MKKVMVCIALISVATSCDNGDMVFENLNFNDIAIQKCDNNELYFKTNSTELLLVDFNRNQNSTDPAAVKSWLSETANLNEVNTLTTTNDLKIVYRTYDASINKSTICSLLAPANPKVTSEYSSVPGGKINYVRILNPAVNEGIVKVSYMYTINFENITLTNGTSEIKYATLPYGSYIYDSTLLSFNFGTNFDVCTETNTLVGNGKNEEIFQLHFPENFQFPTTNQTQNLTLNDDFYITYNRYKSTFNSLNICTPPTENIKEIWESKKGSLQLLTTVSKDPSGKITGYQHQIKMIELQFNYGESTFTIADKIIGTYSIVLN